MGLDNVCAHVKRFHERHGCFCGRRRCSRSSPAKAAASPISSRRVV